MSTLSVQNITGVSDQTVVDMDSTGILTANVVTITGTTTANVVTITGTTTANSFVFNSSIEENVYALSGTTPTLDPSNGTVQTHTLSGTTTYTDGLTAGEAITLMIDDGATQTITWPTMTWVNNGRSAPTLATTGYTVVALWKVSTTLYGALVGDGS